MKTGITASAFILLATSSIAWSQCDMLKDIPNPLAGDMTVTLTGDVECDFVDVSTNVMEEIVIDGGTVTITGESTTKFSNVKFQVADGGSLVFDFAMTNFGPNTGYETADDYRGYMVYVSDGGSVVFNGEMYATDLGNTQSVFYNEAAGSIEFKGNAEFNNCGSSVFRSNLGKLRFRGDATFIDNRYLGIDNEGGTVRITGESYFEHNGHSFNGAQGAAASNDDDGTFIFDGDAVFIDNESSEAGGAVFNNGKMRFYGKAYFYDNRSTESDGGGLAHFGGDLKMTKAVQFKRNRAYESGGAFAMKGDSTASFRKRVTARDNIVSFTGGAMSFLESTSEGGQSPSCEFRKAVDVRDNAVTGTLEDACSAVYIEGEADITGYDAPCN